MRVILLSFSFDNWGNRGTKWFTNCQEWHGSLGAGLWNKAGWFWGLITSMPERWFPRLWGGLDQKARVTLAAQFSIILSIIVVIYHDYHHHCYSFWDLRVTEIANMRLNTSNQNSSAWECSPSPSLKVRWHNVIAIESWLPAFIFP